MQSMRFSDYALFRIKLLYAFLRIKPLYTLPGIFALTACGQPERIELNPPAPPPERMVCEQLPVTPDLQPLEAIKLPDGRLVYMKAAVDARDGAVARYIVEVRAAWFSCHNAVAWIRDYYDEK